MNTGTLAGAVIVPFFAVMMCIAPAVTRPTVPFGVRVPPERARATVIRRERHAYCWRTAAIGACCTVAAPPTARRPGLTATTTGSGKPG